MTADTPTPAAETCTQTPRFGGGPHHTHTDPLGRSWCCVPYPYERTAQATEGTSTGTGLTDRRPGRAAGPGSALPNAPLANHDVPDGGRRG